MNHRSIKDLTIIPFTQFNILPIYNNTLYNSINGTRVFVNIPPLITNDETFTFIEHRVVSNVMFNRYLVSNYGRVYDTCRNKFINPVIGKANYLNITLTCYESYNNLCQKTILLSRLVMLTFCYIPGCENLDVDHIYGDKSKNSIHDLQWVTHEQNIENAKDLRLMPSGERSGRTYISDEFADIICQRLSNGETIVQISTDLNIDYELVKRIKYRVSYRYISEKYIFPENNIHSAKLPDEIVLEIANLLQQGWRNIDIANKFNVLPGVIKGIKSHTFYKHLTEGMYLGELTGYRPPMEAELIHTICKMIEDGISVPTISKQLNVSCTAIYKIKNKQKYTDISSNYNF